MNFNTVSLIFHSTVSSKKYYPCLEDLDKKWAQPLDEEALKNQSFDSISLHANGGEKI